MTDSGQKRDRERAFAPTSGGVSNSSGEEQSSAALQSVLDALLEGKPAPPDAQAVLTEAEHAQVAALARTAHLTRLTLQKPAPSPAAEAAALLRAQEALTNRSRVGRMVPLDGESRPFWRTWWERLTGGSTGRGNR